MHMHMHLQVNPRAYKLEIITYCLVKGKYQLLEK